MRYIFSALIIGQLAVSCGSQAGNKQNDSSAAEVIPVRIAAISRDSGNQVIQVSGYLTTDGEAHLSFKVGGVIDRILVREGDRVRKGQLLAMIKSTEVAAQVSQVRLAFEKAQRDFQRVNNLYLDSVATLEQLQNARTGLEIARQHLQQAGFNEQYSRIYAPADGFVVRKLKNEGELADPGGPVLIVSTQGGISQWVMTAGIPDREWAIVEKGDQASLSFDAFPGKVFTALVSKKSLAADPVSGVFEIELKTSMAGAEPAIGMFGKASIFTSRQVSAHQIPYEALLEANGKSGFVFVTNDGKKATRVPVQIASISQEQVFITGGLEGYRYVIISGSPYLADGTQIHVMH
jgi:RND family efflux transporter MFP subunit